MKKITLLIAQSLDGFVASSDGSVAWLDDYNVPGEDYGLTEFMERVDTVIQGNTTYQQFTPAYPGKNSYVFTKDPQLRAEDGTVFVSADVKSFVEGLDEETHKDIWLVGGPQLAAQFFNEGLIDEMIIHTMPIFLNEGISLFSHINVRPQFELTTSKDYPNGVVELQYRVMKQH